MKKYILSSLLFCACFSTLFAQTKPLAQLKIGDTMPNIALQYTINGQKKTVHTNELKGKLVILDFWNIWCTACIALMPEMNRLQLEFPNGLQVFLVTDNSDQQIKTQFEAIAKRSPAEKSPFEALNSLPSITGDKTLNGLFPHRSVPHHIWIKDGTIKYIAAGYEPTSAIIKAVLSGKDVNITEKKDVGLFDHKADLYTEGGGRLLNYLKYYSMFYNDIPEFNNRRFVETSDSTSQVYKLKCLNFTFLELFRQTTRAKYNQVFFADNRLILEVADSSRFYLPRDISKTSEWIASNIHSYELAVPLKSKGEAYENMLEDLNRYLPFTGRIEKRRLICMALIRTGTNENFVSKPNKSVVQDQVNTGINVENGTISDLIANGLFSLDRKLKMPIVDDTGYNGKIHVYIKSPTKDIESIRGELKAFGLDLVQKEMDVEMLVIKDKK